MIEVKDDSFTCEIASGSTKVMKRKVIFETKPEIEYLFSDEFRHNIFIVIMAQRLRSRAILEKNQKMMVNASLITEDDLYYKSNKEDELPKPKKSKKIIINGATLELNDRMAHGCVALFCEKYNQRRIAGKHEQANIIMMSAATYRDKYAKIY
jgi:hypothetical protein